MSAFFRPENSAFWKVRQRLGYRFVWRVCPFKVDLLLGKVKWQEFSGVIGVIALLVALIVITYWLFVRLKKMAAPEIGFFILFVFLRAIRFVMIRWSFPGSLITSDLFNPEKFASSTLNSSLGDLFLNELACTRALPVSVSDVSAHGDRALSAYAALGKRNPRRGIRPRCIVCIPLSFRCTPNHFQ